MRCRVPTSRCSGWSLGALRNAGRGDAELAERSPASSRSAAVGGLTLISKPFLPFRCFQKRALAGAVVAVAANARK
jgi:hypothetical protein